MVKNFWIVYLFLVVLAFPGCTSTHQTNSLNKLSNEEVEAYNNDPNNTDKIVCRTETGIGTRLPKRACRFESTIDQRARQDQRALEKVQTTGIQNTRKGGG